MGIGCLGEDCHTDLVPKGVILQSLTFFSRSHTLASSTTRSSSVPLIFDLCEPRPDVLRGVTDADFAADLAKVIRGTASPEYKDADKFFANTYPTRGLRNLLANVCERLCGTGGEAASIFRLDTSYGGGKTHGLIALVHAANGMKGVSNIAEFVDPNLVPTGEVRVAAFDGENADPANGRLMGEGVYAHTPWGELAYGLAGKAGYERVRKSDEQMVAPGADTIVELFGDRPTLILLDEISVYLRKARKAGLSADDQLTAFLQSLFKAVESSRRAVLVYTLAIGKDFQATDAYSDENQFIANWMAEAESVSARKATLLNPTEDDETIHVLRRRLFQKVDDAAAAQVIDAYRSIWLANREALGPEAEHPETIEAFRASYPLHPEVLDVLTTKTSTLSNFQRVRGMLRILTRTVAQLWDNPHQGDTTAIHLHHIDVAYRPILQEIVTKLQQGAFVPAIRGDIAGAEPAKALAQEIDESTYKGLAPYATYVGRTVFFNSLAFNEPLKGVTPERLRYSIIGPALEIGFIEDARKKFVASSAYLDDRPTAPMRFMAEANLTQIIRRHAQYVDKAQARAELNDEIKHVFGTGFGPARFQMIPFPAGSYEVPDELGDGKPLLVVMSYDGLAVGGTVDVVPDLIAKIFDRKGAAGTDFRSLRNNLVFLVADDARKEEMKDKMINRLALIELKNPELLKDLAQHQQDKVKELESKSITELAVAIQQCYRHVFYPSRNRVGTSDVDLAHTALDVHTTGTHPGEGQRAVVLALQDLNKLRMPGDEPDAPTYIRDRTPLKKGQMTVAALRDEFRRDPALPILIEDDTFRKAILRGIEQGEYVYRHGDLLAGKGEPLPMIIIDEQSIVFTSLYAQQHGIWPRQPKPAEPGTGLGSTGSTGGLFGPTSGSIPGSGGGTSSTGTTTPAPATPAQKQFTAQAILRDALVQLWEQARAAKVAKIGSLEIKIYEAGDAFKLLGAVGAISNATKKVVFEGGYATKEGSEFEFTFRGLVEDAKPVKEFLDAQFRAASDPDLNTTFIIQFEHGLELAGDAAEKMTEKLVRFASGAAYVTATAEVQQ